MKLFNTLMSVMLCSFVFSQNYVDTVYTISSELNIEYGKSNDFAGNETSLLMDISYPNNDIPPACGRPLALIVHGGAWAAGSKEDGNIVRMRKDFAKRGYVTATINYRLGYFQTNVSKNCNIENWNCFNLADSSEWIRAWYRGVQDAKGALRHLILDAANYNIDPSNVFVFGESAGAYISLGVAFMDVEAEKPASCGAISSVLAPHQDYFNPCIKNRAYETPISSMDLTRPDLGSINGSLNPTDLPYIIKGAGSMYGGIFTDLFTEKSFFTVPRLYLFHQPNDLIVPINSGKLLQGYNTCAVNNGGCATIFDRPFTYGGQGIKNLIDTLGITPQWKPEMRPEFTNNTVNCIIQVLDPLQGGHQFDSYWNRTTSMADFFSEVIGTNDCNTLLNETNELKPSINVYPNPAKNSLFLSGSWEDAQLVIFDSQGKKVLEKSNLTTDEMDIRNLQEGLYIVKIYSKEEVITQKFIKEN